MLKQFHENLREGGLLILAVVLPFQPFVEKGWDHYTRTAWSTVTCTLHDDVDAMSYCVGCV